MTGPCKRRKVRNPSSKVSRKTRRGASVAKRTVVHDPTVGRYWDPARTISQNFSVVGLAARVNSDLAGKKVQRKVDAWQGERTGKLIAKLSAEDTIQAFSPMDLLEGEEMFAKLDTLFEQETETQDLDEGNEPPSQDKSKPAIKHQVIVELERRAAVKVEKAPPRLSEHDQKYIERLVAKYGNNFKKMALDHRLNAMQWTARQLEKMALIMQQK